MGTPKIVLKPINGEAELIKDIHKNYVRSIDDIHMLFAVLIDHHEVAVCNVMETENGFKVVDYIGSSQSLVKFIEEKLEEMTSTKDGSLDN